MESAPRDTPLQGDAETGQEVTVWVVEDSSDFRSTVRDIIDAEPDLRCPQAFSTAEALLEHLETQFAPELILMDIGLPGMDGIEATKRVKEISPATYVVMLTIHQESDRIFQAICNGASGYLSKNTSREALLRSVREVIRGGAAMTPQIARRVMNMFAQMHAPRRDYQLTKREKEVLRELIEGTTKEQIAKSLFLSVHTVDTHVRSIYAKLHVHSRSGAVAKALKERLLPGQMNLE